MSNLFDPHNVKIMEFNGDGVVDELDYKTLLVLYDDARSQAAAAEAAVEACGWCTIARNKAG